MKSRAPIAVANYYTACKSSTVKAGSIATAREGLGLDSAGFACYAVPNKTHKNMAYYDESYAEMIMLIKKFQKEYFLPLEVIKNAIDELGHDKVPNMANELVEKLVQAKQLDWMEPASVDKLVRAMTREELIDATKISEADLESSLKAGLVFEDENKCFNVQDVKIAMLISEVRSFLTDDKGFSIDFITMHNDMIKEAVDKQFKYFLVRILNGSVNP